MHPRCPFSADPLISQSTEKAPARTLKIIRYRVNPPISPWQVGVFQQLKRTSNMHATLLRPCGFNSSTGSPGRCKTAGPPIRQAPRLRRLRGSPSYDLLATNWIEEPARLVLCRRCLRRTSRGKTSLQEMRSALRLTTNNTKYFQLRPHIRARNRSAYRKLPQSIPHL